MRVYVSLYCCCVLNTRAQTNNENSATCVVYRSHNQLPETTPLALRVSCATAVVRRLNVGEVSQTRAAQDILTTITLVTCRARHDMKPETDKRTEEGVLQVIFPARPAVLRLVLYSEIGGERIKIGANERRRTTKFASPKRWGFLCARWRCPSHESFFRIFSYEKQDFMSLCSWNMFEEGVALTPFPSPPLLPPLSLPVSFVSPFKAARESSACKGSAMLAVMRQKRQVEEDERRARGLREAREAWLKVKVTGFGRVETTPFLAVLRYYKQLRSCSNVTN